MTKKIKTVDGSFRKSSNESLDRHIQAKRDLRKKQLIEKILESESDKKLRLKKEKRKSIQDSKNQSRMNKDVRRIENADTTLGGMHFNKDSD